MIADLWEAIRLFLEDDQALVAWAVGLSILMFVGSLIAVPIVVVQMRADFFVRDSKEQLPRTPLRVLRRLAKNVLGWVLLLAGIAMLVLPGQGLLTMALGLGLMDFPGKRGLQRWLVGLKGVGLSINWIRRRAEKPPLELPDRFE